MSSGVSPKDQPDLPGATAFPDQAAGGTGRQEVMSTRARLGSVLHGVEPASPTSG